ncbi:MAG: hypothetical protein ACRC62_13750 [Microcoleus sp.]
MQPYYVLTIFWDFVWICMGLLSLAIAFSLSRFPASPQRAPDDDNDRTM